MNAICLASFLLLVAVGCSKKAALEESFEKSRPATDVAHPEHHEDEAAHRDALPRKVRLPSEVVKNAGIRTAPAAVETLPSTVSLTGEVAADPDKSAQVTVRAPGRLSEVHFTEGEQVKKGQLLAVVESPDAGKARAQAQSTDAHARTARANAERLKRLEEKGLAAGQDVRAAEAEATALEAQAASARDTLRAFGAVAWTGTSARLELRAPLDGTVLTRDAVRGQTLSAEHVLTTVANLESALFLGRLFEKDIARVHEGAATEVRLNAYPKEVFEGTVESIGRQLDPQARTVVARIRVKDRNALLKVGLFGTALVTEPTEAPAPKEGRVVVPLSAVTQLANRDAVFVAHPDGDFEVHEVTLGRSAGGRVEVLAGVNDGEQVVVDGVFTLKSTVLKSSFGEEGH